MRLGIPSGLAIAVEVTSFTLVALFVARQGTLATAAAQLQLQARLKPEPTSEAATPPATAPASKPGASKPSTPRTTPAPAADPMQADLAATLAPWAQQPLQSANATLRAVNLAALWPHAPVTQLHGTLQAGPTSGGAGTAGAAGWSLQAALRNDLPGPWDTTRLPLTALDASASYDGTRWTVPNATLQAGTGSITAQGHYTPATHALEGQATLRALRPDALHTLLAAAPLSGRVTAQTQGEAVRFSADVRADTGTAARAATTKTTAAAGAPLRINAFSTQGTWQAADGGTVRLDRLLLECPQGLPWRELRPIALQLLAHGKLRHPGRIHKIQPDFLGNTAHRQHRTPIPAKVALGFTNMNNAVLPVGVHRGHTLFVCRAHILHR